MSPIDQSSGKGGKSSKIGSLRAAEHTSELDRGKQFVAESADVTTQTTSQLANIVQKAQLDAHLLRSHEVQQLQHSFGNRAVSQLFAQRANVQPEQKADNKTGLSDELKSGIETLSGHSMDAVKVHYNSDKPAQVQAHAYAQGTDIHVASGQEKHLPHEAWHVVQQAEGRVKPTMQLEGGVLVNDDESLEREADVMGAKALQRQHLNRAFPINKLGSIHDVSGKSVQLRVRPSSEETPIQLASVYNGAPIRANTGKWGAYNLAITDTISYGGATAQDTAKQTHAERLYGDWAGNPVGAFPVDWAKFTQLVGPYAVKNLVQGHLLNQKMGGSGDAENLAPLAASANTRHWNSVESPIRQWLDQNPRNLIDYKITPNYGGARASLKTKLIDEFKANHDVGTADTGPNLHGWVSNYIDQTIPSELKIDVAFAQTNAGTRARKKETLEGSISNTNPATYTGARITGYCGRYSSFRFGITNTIGYGGVGPNNTGEEGHANMIDDSHAGTAVGSHPTDWEKFTRLVGPDAVTDFVQGHLINQKIGGEGIAQNLTPLTSSANAVHSTRVETPIQHWLSNPDTADGKKYLIDYRVSPVYSGADSATKKSLLESFDDTNAEIQGDTGPALLTWVSDYIDATFPSGFGIEVQFMQADNVYDIGHHRERAKSKPLLQGEVTNEPA